MGEELTLAELLNTEAREFLCRPFLKISEEKILHWFDLCDAVWLHDGNPESPHAELTSGKCSNGYFNCSRVLKYPNLNEILACMLYLRLVDKLREMKMSEINWVIGSPYAAITFSYEAAKSFGAIHGFPEKSVLADREAKPMIWKRETIPADATVLQIEELITTSNTFQRVREAVKEGNKWPVRFLPIVGTLVHRPSKLPINYEIADEEGATKIQIVSLVEKEVWAVDPKKCPLCKDGSKRLRPKTHWKELTGKN